MPCEGGSGSRAADAVGGGPIGREAILALVPHQGAMCLWDAVRAWDARSIHVIAHNHRDPAHPLRSAGRLRALHLCEYGAQAMAVHGGLLARAAGTRAEPGLLVSLTGLHDPAAVARVAADNGAQLLDLKQASESLVVEYRQRVLFALVGAALLLVLTVWLALRQPRRVLRVLAPMALTTLLILAVLRGFGVELNLFHLVALILAAGLGLDYGLFFDHAGDSREEQLRTLHAVIVCSLTTLLVFALLALSSIPVLRAIGSTVAIGVFGNFVLALLVTRRPAALDDRG